MISLNGPSTAIYLANMSSKFITSPIPMSPIEERLTQLYRRRTVVEALIQSLEDYGHLAEPEPIDRDGGRRKAS